MIELLVVMAIIAILAAILLPALSKAKKMASNSVCINNLKQMMIATFSYAEYNRDYIPLPYDTTNGNKTWYNVMIPDYIKDNIAFYSCPLLPLNPTGWAGYAKYGMKYPINSYASGHIRLGQECRIQVSGLGRTVDTSKFILWGDSVYTTEGAQVYYIKDNCWGTADTKYSLHLRHMRNANCAFIDGHAEGINSSELPGLGFDSIHFMIDK